MLLYAVVWHQLMLSFALCCWLESNDLVICCMMMYVAVCCHLVTTDIDRLIFGYKL